MTEAFEQRALALFREQAQADSVYREFITHLGVAPGGVPRMEEIPFLPIRFFKSHRV